MGSHAASARTEADLLPHSLLDKAPELWTQDFEFIYLTRVELRRFEPLTSCMPFLTNRLDASIWSDTRRSNRMVSLTASGCARSHLRA